MVQLLGPVIAYPPLSQTNPLPTNPRLPIRNNHGHVCCSTRYGGRDGGSRWYSNPKRAIRNEHFNFNFEDEIVTDDEDDEDEAFGFRSATMKNRNWWSDDNFFDDAENEVEFGVLEGSIGGIAWISKVFRAFGWMVPAIVISMLLGTGPNALFMALALPLAQSAVYLVIDTLWTNNPNDNPRSKPGPKRRRPFARAASASNVETSRERETERDHHTANVASVNKGKRNTPNFGGWDDELDEQRRTEKVPLMVHTRKANQQNRRQKGKLSRIVRNRDKPLALRLFVAIFPFLGSWTKLF